MAERKIDFLQGTYSEKLDPIGDGNSKPKAPARRRGRPRKPQLHGGPRDHQHESVQSRVTGAFQGQDASVL